MSNIFCFPKIFKLWVLPLAHEWERGKGRGSLLCDSIQPNAHNPLPKSLSRARERDLKQPPFYQIATPKFATMRTKFPQTFDSKDEYEHQIR